MHKVDVPKQVKQETSQFRHYEFDKYFAEVHEVQLLEPAPLHFTQDVSQSWHLNRTVS
jgi:hypothetical protein